MHGVLGRGQQLKRARVGGRPARTHCATHTLTHSDRSASGALLLHDEWGSEGVGE